jgi:hypothetical protein
MPGDVADCVHAICSKEDTEDVNSNRSDDEENEENEVGSINEDVTEDNDSHEVTESYMSRETHDQIIIEMNNQSNDSEDNVINVDPTIKEHFIQEDFKQTLDDNDGLHKADRSLSGDVEEALPESVSMDNNNLDGDMNEKYGKV